jgi:hypothetical protein
VSAGSIDEALSMELDVIDRQLAEPRARAPLSPWHIRRMFGFGASDVPALLVGLGARDPLTVPGHVRANAALVRHGDFTVPRIVLEKAGVKAPLKSGRAASIGTAREAELVNAWRDTYADEYAVDPASVRHMSIMPRELQAAIRDPECPFLAASLDGWCRDALTGELLTIEAKCGHMERDGLPWYWQAQVAAQLACTGLNGGFVVLGQMWARGPDVHGPIVTWNVWRNDALIAEIRKAACVGWSWVAAIKEAK